MAKDDDKPADKADDKAQAESAAAARLNALAAAKADEGSSRTEVKSNFVEKPPPAANIVRVGCKLPHGLKLRLSDAATGEDGKKAFVVREGATFTLKGRNASQIVGGYGITDVPKDFWDEWVAQNPKFKALVSGAIFAEPTRARALDRAIDQREVRTGSEPLDPDKPGPGLSKVDEKDQRAAAGMRDGG